MTDYPQHLYRDGAEFVWEGRSADTVIVRDAAEHETRAAQGWMTAADYIASPPKGNLLDQPARIIKDELSKLSLEDLEGLKAGELAGKTRQSVMTLIEAAIDAKLEN